jgi:peroxiredoxin
MMLKAGIFALPHSAMWLGLWLTVSTALMSGCAQQEPSVSTGPVSQPAEAAPSQATAPRENPPAEEPQQVAPAKETPEPIVKAAETEAPLEKPEPIAQAADSGPQGRTAFYRADASPAEIPPVVLTKGHAVLCRVKVGDQMPEFELPAVDRDGESTRLRELIGTKATVVVFWKSDRRMALEQLADLGPDVVRPFGEQGVTVVGIAVDESPDSAQATLREAGATFANLLDSDGRAFSQVGSEKLPRTYLLDPQAKILWFDIEYSLATRRELHQALRAMVGDKPD